MAYVIGIVLALGVFAFARWTGFDRDRAFYPTVVVVVAQYYVLFATMSGAGHALVVESIVMAVFVLVAVLGFKFNAWLPSQLSLRTAFSMRSTDASWRIPACPSGGPRSA